MNKRNIIIIVVIVNIVLAASIVTLYFTVFNGSNNLEEQWTLTITGDVEQDIVFVLNDTINELALLPSITQDYTIQESGTSIFTAEYTGISLYYLVAEIANISTNVDVVIRAIDQYSRTYNLNEIESIPDMIIAYLKDGQNIRSYYKGGTGPLRLIVPQEYEGDYNGQHCVKFVTEIEIKLL